MPTVPDINAGQRAAKMLRNDLVNWPIVKTNLKDSLKEE